MLNGQGGHLGMSPNNASMQEFKVNLPSTVMFNYPTIEGITGPGTEELGVSMVIACSP